MSDKITPSWVFDIPGGLKIKDIVREYLLRTLAETRGNRRRTSRLLGIGIRTLQRKLKVLASQGFPITPPECDHGGKK
jgi:DNA-binding NtrC family response regulator